VHTCTALAVCTSESCEERCSLTPLAKARVSRSDLLIDVRRHLHLTAFGAVQVLLRSARNDNKIFVVGVFAQEFLT
jgi:hypothetical protein